MGEVDLPFSLPEDCICRILSLTTPKDVCRWSILSSPIKSATESNITWEKFLPSDYETVLAISVLPVKFSSKKELYFHLCKSILIDGGKKSFSLEKSTGKKCYILSARELSITWGDNSMYWSWKPTPGSRFPEAVELRSIWWLEIKGKIDACMLSPKTIYAAYLILKISHRAYGLHLMPCKMFVEVRDHVCKGIAFLLQELKSSAIEVNKQVIHNRNDGWMEIELGEFSIQSGDEGEVKMSFTEIEGYQLKAGIVIEGIELRPKVRD